MSSTAALTVKFSTDGGDGSGAPRASVEIAADYDGDLAFNETPLRVFPSDPDRIVTGPQESVSTEGNGTLTIDDTLVFESSTTSTPSRWIDRLTNAKWQKPILTPKGNPVVPDPSVAWDDQRGVLTTPEPVFGVIAVSYEVDYDVVVLTHAKKPPGNNPYFLKDGTVVVVHGRDMARETIPAPVFDLGQTEQVAYRITSRYLAESGASPGNLWEVPSGWPNSLEFDTGEEAPDDTEAAELVRTHEIGWLKSGGGIRRETFTVTYHQPKKSDPQYTPEITMTKYLGDLDKIDWCRVESTAKNDYSGITIRPDEKAPCP